MGELKNGINKAAKDFGHGIPFVNLMDVFGKDEININSLGLVNVSAEEQERYELKKSDILFIRSSVKREGVAQIILIDELGVKLVYSGFLIRFRGNKEHIFSGFDKYCFVAPSFRKQVLRYATTSANTNINQDSLEKINIYLPEIKEQQKIASFLSAVDKKIELLIKKHELLEKFKKGLMQKIFSQEMRFKQDDGGEFPDWEESFLEKKIFLQSGFPFKSKYFNGSDKKVLRIGDIKKNIRCELFKGIFTNEACEDKYKVNENDFVIALSGATFGKIGKVKDQEEYFINQRVAAVRTKENLEFFFQLFDSELFKKYLLSVPSIGAQPNISNDDIYKFSYFFPTIKEQQKIASFLSALDKKIDLVKQQIEKTQTFKKGLLQQMFV
ncbi:restriction endonuclease subunit S [Methylophilaceae bacterium]|nr:restriction endonuclease subunit S [Methylophilaceae bacterium]